MVHFLFTTVTVFHVPLLVYYCHRSTSCLLHVTFVSYQKNPFDITVCLYHHVSVLFPSSLRFVIVYHSCVPTHKTKRSMSQLTNPITPTDFVIIEIRLSYFHNFFIFFWVNRSNCVSNDSQHTSFPLLIRTH